MIESAECHYKQLFKDHFKSNLINDYTVEIHNFTRTELEKSK